MYQEQEISQNIELKQFVIKFKTKQNQRNKNRKWKTKNANRYNDKKADAN